MTATTSKSKAWSYSRLSAFELCPKKFAHEQVIRDVANPPNSMASYGTEAHKAFELRLLKGRKLPLDLRHHESKLAKFAAVPGELMPEQKIGVNADFRPTGFFDADVWCRGIVDFAAVTDRRALFVDWKFGRLKDGFDQLDLQMLLLAAALPEVEEFRGMFYWAKDKVITPKTYTRVDIPDLWAGFLPRVEYMNKCIDSMTFTAKPGFLCKRWCGVTRCPYHGG